MSDQRDLMIEKLSAENSIQGQEIIALRREVEKLRRTVGDLFQSLAEANETQEKPWHSDGGA